MLRIQYDRFGGSDQLALEQVDLEAPDDRRVSVKIRAASVNPVDFQILDGSLKLMTGRKFPRGMGLEFSGIVESVGVKVARFRVGDAVFGLSSLKAAGAFAERIVIDESLLAGKPETISFEQAACLAAAGGTAQMVVDKAGLAEGSAFFINGCHGAVGQAAVQIAKMRGAVVTGTCHASVAADARRIGADTVLDYDRLDWTALEGHFDAVVDTANVMPVGQAMDLLKPSGVFLDIHPTPWKILRYLFNPRYRMIALKVTPALLGELANAAAQGKLKFNIAEIAALEKAIPLIAAMSAGKKLRGKAIIMMGA